MIIKGMDQQIILYWFTIEATLHVVFTLPLEGMQGPPLICVFYEK